MDHGMDDGSGHASMTHQMVMQMTFINSPSVTLLWSWWKTESYRSYIPSLLLLIIVGIFTVYLKALRVDVDGKVAAWNAWQSATIRGVLALVSLTFEYFLMLCVMTFNVGVFISVIFGVAIGVAFFSTRLNSQGRLRSKERQLLLANPDMANPDYCDCPCSQSIHLKARAPTESGPTTPGVIDSTQLDPTCCPP